MAAVLVGAGYIGAALLAKLTDAKEPVVAMDNGFATDLEVVQALCDRAAAPAVLLRGDVRNEADIEAAFRAARALGSVEVVYLLAAQASAHPAAASDAYTEQTNVTGGRQVLEAAVRHGAAVVVFGSSFHVYGGGLAGDVDETQPYGAFRDLSHLSKVYVEKLGEMYSLTRGLRFASVRLGIVYGLGPIVKRDLRFVTVPHAFCLRALAGQPLEVHAGARSHVAFIHLDDAVKAMRVAGRGNWKGAAPANAAPEVLQVAQVARYVESAARGRGLPVTIAGAGDEPAKAPFIVRSRLEHDGWRPAHRLPDSIGSVLDFYAEGATARSGAQLS